MAPSPNPTERLLREQLTRQQAQIDRLVQQHEALGARLESSLEQQHAGVQNILAISVSLEQQQAGVHSQIRAISARQDATELQQEAVMVSMLNRMQTMMQLTIQQSIGALLPQLTQSASVGGTGQSSRLLLAAPAPPLPLDSQQQGGGTGVAGGSPPTPSVRTLHQ